MRSGSLWRLRFHPCCPWNATRFHPVRAYSQRMSVELRACVESLKPCLVQHHASRSWCYHACYGLLSAVAYSLSKNSIHTALHPPQSADRFALGYLASGYLA